MPLRRTKKNDKIKQGYKFLALPNKDQKVKFSKTFGCTRKYWNIAKSDSIENYKNNKTFVINSPHFYKEKEERFDNAVGNDADDMVDVRCLRADF